MEMPDLIDAKEAAQALRFSSLNPFYKWVRREKPPHYRVGKKLYFVLEELLNFCRSGHNDQSVESDQSNQRSKQCHFSKEETPTGVVSLHQMESEYDALLKPRTKRKPKSSKTA